MFTNFLDVLAWMFTNFCNVWFFPWGLATKHSEMCKNEFYTDGEMPHGRGKTENLLSTFKNILMSKPLCYITSIQFVHFLCFKNYMTRTVVATTTSASSITITTTNWLCHTQYITLQLINSLYTFIVGLVSQQYLMYILLSSTKQLSKQIWNSK